jgi:transportin-3
MTEWKDVVQLVVSTLGNSKESHACILDFLKVLPEEVTEGRKINLTVCGPRNTIQRIHIDVGL